MAVSLKNKDLTIFESLKKLNRKILPKLIKENEIKKFKKINFLSIYLSLFVFSYISVSITYYFLGSPNISNSMLLEIKEKKQLVKQEQMKKIKKTNKF